jgi:hypothetical protein
MGSVVRGVSTTCRRTVTPVLSLRTTSIGTSAGVSAGTDHVSSPAASDERTPFRGETIASLLAPERDRMPPSRSVPESAFSDGHGSQWCDRDGSLLCESVARYDEDTGTGDRHFSAVPVDQFRAGVCFQRQPVICSERCQGPHLCLSGNPVPPLHAQKEKVPVALRRRFGLLSARGRRRRGGDHRPRSQQEQCREQHHERHQDAVPPNTRNPTCR